MLVEASCDPRWTEICRLSTRARPRRCLSESAVVRARRPGGARRGDGQGRRLQISSVRSRRFCVRLDILRRQLREEHAVLIQQGKRLLDCMVILMPRFAALKAGYKLEALG